MNENQHTTSTPNKNHHATSPLAFHKEKNQHTSFTKRKINRQQVSGAKISTQQAPRTIISMQVFQEPNNNFFSSWNWFSSWNLLRADFCSCWFFSSLNLQIDISPLRTDFVHGTCYVLSFARRSCCELIFAHEIFRLFIFFLRETCILIFSPRDTRLVHGACCMPIFVCGTCCLLIFCSWILQKPKSSRYQFQFQKSAPSRQVSRR